MQNVVAVRFVVCSRLLQCHADCCYIVTPLVDAQHRHTRDTPTRVGYTRTHINSYICRHTDEHVHAGHQHKHTQSVPITAYNCKMKRHTRTHTCTHARTRTHARTHERSHTHTHTHTHVCMHTHARTHTHTHTHTHNETTPHLGESKDNNL